MRLARYFLLQLGDTWLVTLEGHPIGEQNAEYLTLRAIQVDPAAAVHVGDDPVLDVAGARQAGLRVIQVTSASLKSLRAQRPDAVIPSLATLPEALASLDRG